MPGIVARPQSRDIYLIFKMSAAAHQLETFVSLASPKIDEKANDLQKLSLKIWERPELGYEEHFAHGILSDFFEEQGFEVTREYTLPTAFRAVFGGEKVGPTVAVLCEYDALPGVGHGCGHNLIAVAGNFFSFLRFRTSSTLRGGGTPYTEWSMRGDSSRKEYLLKAPSI